MAQVGAGAAGAGHDDLGSVAAGEFKDERAGEMNGGQFFEQGGPVDPAIAGREVVVAMAFVVVDMEQPQVGGHFVNQRVKIAGEVGVAGVEAGADAVAFERGQDPEQVGGLSKEQVRQLVFQHALDPEFAATQGHAVEHGADIFDTQQALVAGGNVGVLGSGVDDKILHADERGCLDRAEDLGQRVFPLRKVEGGNIDVRPEGGVEGIRFHAEVVDEQGRLLHGLTVAVVEVCGGKDDLDHAEAALPDGFEAIGQWRAVEAAGGKSDGPVVHTSRASAGAGGRQKVCGGTAASRISAASVSTLVCSPAKMRV